MIDRLLVLIFLIFMCVAQVQAQQDKLLTHFMFDKMSFNPGETGIEEGICGTALFRNQWGRVNGAPNSTLFNVEANINRYFIGGAGISFYNDVVGFATQNSLLLNYAYPVYFERGTLGVGMGLGIINYGLNPTWVPPTATVDNSLPIGFASTKLDANFGLYWKGKEDYYVGLSSTHLTQPGLDFGSNPIGVTTEYRSVRHYYLMGGKRVENIYGGDIDAQVLLRTDAIKFSADINARYFRTIAGRRVYGGLSYRTSDGPALLLGGMIFPNMQLGYSYDITMNKLSTISRGSHEIVLKYCYFLPPLPVQKSKHPRWL
jgi:type IX secretion system PorP/SprF family membrane protein